MVSSATAWLVAIVIALAASSPRAQGQGSINLANIQAPLSDCEGKLLNPGFTVQLQLADGTAIGEATAILVPGLFSGGSRIVDGIAGGQSIEVKLEVRDPNGDYYGETLPVSVLTGGEGTPPSLPGALPPTLALDCDRPKVFQPLTDTSFQSNTPKSIDLLALPYPLAGPAWFAVPEDQLTINIEPATALPGGIIENGTLIWTPSEDSAGAIDLEFIAIDSRDGTILDRLETQFTVLSSTPVSPPLTVTQSAPATFQPGFPLNLSANIVYEGDLISLLWRPEFPNGWLLNDFSGDGTMDLDPVTGELIWLGQIPPSPIKISLEIIPSDQSTGQVALQNWVEYQLQDQVNPSLAQATPAPSLISKVVPPPPPALLAIQTLEHRLGDRSQATVTLTITTSSSLLSLLAKPSLPDGWSIEDLAGTSDPEWNPSTNEILWSGQIPESPVEVRYQAVRHSGDRPLQIDHTIEYQPTDAINAVSLPAEPTKLQALEILGIQVAKGVRLQFNAREDLYYILFRQDTLGSAPVMVDIILEADGPASIGEEPPPTPSAFYQLKGYPYIVPHDVDEDGVNDLIEIQSNRNPLVAD